MVQTRTIVHFEELVGTGVAAGGLGGVEVLLGLSAVEEFAEAAGGGLGDIE